MNIQVLVHHAQLLGWSHLASADGVEGRADLLTNPLSDGLVVFRRVLNLCPCVVWCWLREALLIRASRESRAKVSFALVEAHSSSHLMLRLVQPNLRLQIDIVAVGEI